MEYLIYTIIFFTILTLFVLYKRHLDKTAELEKVFNDDFFNEKYQHLIEENEDKEKARLQFLFFCYIVHEGHLLEEEDYKHILQQIEDPNSEYHNYFNWYTYAYSYLLGTEHEYELLINQCEGQSTKYKAAMIYKYFHMFKSLIQHEFIKEYSSRNYWKY